MYRGMRIQDRRRSRHAFFRVQRLPELLRAQFQLAQQPEPAMLPRDAQAAMAPNRVH